MQSSNKVIPFMRFRNIAGVFSIILLLASISSLAIQGLNLGLDFSGGTLVEMKFDKAVDVEQVRQYWEQEGIDSAVVVHFGSDEEVMVRMRDNLDQQAANELASGFSSQAENPVEVKRVEFVGPQIGDELREDGGLGLLAALIVVMLYVAIRFQYKFSIAAVIALFHDVVITLGLFSIFQWEFDLTVLAALLAVIGYSLNDTIVVFDRVRENFRELRGLDVIESIDVSLSQTLSRTLVTSLTTLLVLTVLFFFGGEMIHMFALGLIIGVGIGTYSSVYVASFTVVLLGLQRKDLLPPEDTSDKELQEEVPYS